MSYVPIAAQKEIDLTAPKIAFFTDVGGTNGLFVNGNTVSGSTTTVSSAVVGLSPSGAITSITTRGVTGAPNVTPVGYTLKISGNEATLCLDSFVINTIVGGAPNAITIAVNLPANAQPALATTAMGGFDFVNGGTHSTGGFLLVAPAQNFVTINTLPLTAITTAAGLSLDHTFKWIVNTQ